MRDDQLAGEVYKLYARCIAGELTREGVLAQLLTWKNQKRLTTAVLHDVDLMLERLEISQAEYAMQYRMLNLDAARITGDPRLVGNAAAAASLVAIHLEKDSVRAADLQVQAIESLATVRNTVTVAGNFRNVALLFRHGVAIAPRTFVPMLERLVAALMHMVATSWKPALVAECVGPTIECLQCLVLATNQLDFFRPFAHDLRERVIPKLPGSMQQQFQYDLAVALGSVPAR
jgi:hypothetical protein